MVKVLHVISGLEASSGAKQLTLLAEEAQPGRAEEHLIVLGHEGLFASRLRQAGLEPEYLEWVRLLDPRPFWRLRRMVQEYAPDVIHVWNGQALRLVCLALAGEGSGAHAHPPLLVSSPLQGEARGQNLFWLNRWLLRRAYRLIVTCQAEARSCVGQGLPEARLCLIPLAVALPPEEFVQGNGEASHHQVDPALASLSLPPTARFLACAGRLEPAKGFRNVIWAFDMLGRIYADLHLLVIGEGPERHRLEQFARIIGCGDRVHFLGQQKSVPALLAQSEVVLVPSRMVPGGMNVALEAMAVGRPVVASGLGGLAEIVVPGETGYLFAPEDKMGMARHLRRLLDDAGLRRRLGQAGRQRAADVYDVSTRVERLLELYESAASALPTPAREPPVPIP